jgi:sigma-E factor negative regulatory protein RseC
MNKSIQHIGVIEKIEHPVVYVRILQQSACSGCQVKSFCPTSDASEKVIEIEDRSGNFAVNEKVNICAQLSQGMTAVFLAFVMPLIILVATLVIAPKASATMSDNEIAVGLVAILILIPYYGIIRLMRNKLKKKFMFTLSKIT